VLFLLKNCKNRQTLGALSPEPLASGGWRFRPQDSHISHPTLRILLSASPHKTQTLSESTKRPYFLIIKAGVNQTFGVEKIMLHFVCHRLRKL